VREWRPTCYGDAVAYISVEAAAVNPVAAWMVGILGLGLWMVFHPHSNKGPKILLLIMAFVIFGPLSDAVMNAESNSTPLKFDYILQLVDNSLGLSAFTVARLFNDWQRSLLFHLYESLSLFMILWYVLHLNMREGRPARLLLSYLAAYVSGPCLYLVVPGRGPRHAFGSLFPMGNPDVTPVLVRLGGWPNAMPSIHMATALLLVLFAGKKWLLRLLAWAYLAGTIASTLAFEHYVIDLIVAVPFACFAAHLAEGRLRQALSQLAVVLVWLFAIRFAFPFLIAYPLLVKGFALATVGYAAFGMMVRDKSGKSRPSGPGSTSSLHGVEIAVKGGE